MRSLGARSVPVVARDGKFVYAQVMGDVVEFLGLNEATGPALDPDALALRADHVLATAIRLTRQMPESALENVLPNRPRSWLVLMHHVFQIPAAFLDCDRAGIPFTYEMLVEAPPVDMRSSVAVAEYGEAVRARFKAWWVTARGGNFSRTISTYFGDTSRHEMLERTVWHTAQHVRQVSALLESVGVRPERPLSKADIAGLPLTDAVWDEAG